MLSVIPYPIRINDLPGRFSIPDRLGAELGDYEDWCINAYSHRTGRKADEKIWLKLRRDHTLPAEGYRLSVRENGVTVHASGERGVVWALTTLAELEQDGTVSCCEIEDAPKYPHRGLSLDCARHFFSAAEVKKVIEEMSLFKLNVLHWHLSDDQGWRIESKRFPKLHETSGDYFTQDEIRDVAAFARDRGVEIVPEIDLPGHTTGILAAYPQYSCSGKPVQLAACGGIYPVILCAGKDTTFDFIGELLDEIIPLFPGERFHIGGDEAPKSEWKKCPHCQKRMAALGITYMEDLQGWFSGRVTEILKRHGKRPVCWNETLRARNYPKEAEIQYWTLQYRGTMQNHAEHGGKWIYSDMFELYLDYPCSMTSLKKVYETTPHLGRTSFADTPGLLGMEGCLWAEHITDPERLENLLFPRACALAEICWSDKGNYADFTKRLEAVIAGRLHQDIRCTPRDWWDPKGSARRREAIGFFTTINSGMSSDVKEQTVEAAAPSKEFAQSFMTKFFKPLDIPFLLKRMMKR